MLEMTSVYILSAVGSATAGAIVSPLVILVLCVVAGIGTVMLLPAGGKEAPVRKFGAVILIAAGLILAALLVRVSGGELGNSSVYFWIFSAVAIVGAIRVITHQRPVYSALYFVLTVFASAGLFVLLWAQFMAAALVLIYAGAILVTYVFVIMLASQTSATTSNNRPAMAAELADYDARSREPVVAAAVGFALMGVFLFVIFDKAQGLQPLSTTATTGTTQELGTYLFKNQLVNLELAGLLLTVAMVGAIVIARRRIEGAEPTDTTTEVVTSPATPIDDNPRSIPVYGTENPRQKEFPET